MRAARTIVVAVGAALIVGAIPSVAGAGPTKGTWTYVDTTPDPTTLENPATHHCHGTLPSAPVDVNNQTFKAKKKGVLTLTSHNALDWAMEVRDSKGNVVAGTDGANVDDKENMTVMLKKGTYQVVYCSFAGEPTITVDYRFK